MDDLEMKVLNWDCDFVKVSKDYYIKYDYSNVILLNSSFERIAYLKPANNTYDRLKVLVLNDGKIIVAYENFVEIYKIENKVFKRIQRISDERLTNCHTTEIIELKNQKIVIAKTSILVILKKENEEYIIEHIIKVEDHQNQIEYIVDNKILLLLEQKDLYILDFSEDNFKKQKLNVNLNINVNLLSQYKCMFKLKNDIIIFVIGNNLHFFNLKYEEVICIYETNGRMTDLIYFRDDSYLCCFPGLKKICLATFDKEFIIKDSRSYTGRVFCNIFGGVCRKKIFLKENKLFIYD